MKICFQMLLGALLSVGAHAAVNVESEQGTVPNTHNTTHRLSWPLEARIAYYGEDDATHLVLNPYQFLDLNRGRELFPWECPFEVATKLSLSGIGSCYPELKDGLPGLLLKCPHLQVLNLPNNMMGATEVLKLLSGLAKTHPQLVELSVIGNMTEEEMASFVLPSDLPSTLKVEWKLSPVLHDKKPSN